MDEVDKTGVVIGLVIIVFCVLIFRDRSMAHEYRMEKLNKGCPEEVGK